MIETLLENNIRWAAARTRDDPGFFKRLSGQQAPEYLWIGCSDSRVPANEIVGLDPGELFVHRNVANLLPASDLNSLSVLQFAIESLQVRHIIVCGHYGCGGVAAAMEDRRHGMIDHWIEPIRRLQQRRQAEIDEIADAEARGNRLSELNVMEQVEALAANPLVRDAWRRRRPLTLHGFIYSIRDGLLRTLCEPVSSAKQARVLAAAGSGR